MSIVLSFRHEHRGEQHQETNDGENEYLFGGYSQKQTFMSVCNRF